ncbi:MAG: hypothetical protein II771_06880, partial [Clostridia bacterium]|nr:hypothetical protein [Clostridia bacterium]
MPDAGGAERVGGADGHGVGGGRNGGKVAVGEQKTHQIVKSPRVDRLVSRGAHRGVEGGEEGVPHAGLLVCRPRFSGGAEPFRLLFHPFADLRGGIIFPLDDRNGRTVAFSGRIFHGEDFAKYINTKETPIF